MTVREDVGEIVLSTTIIGETALPISVDVSVTGTASEMQGLLSFQLFLLIVNLLVSLFVVSDFVWSTPQATMSFNSGKSQYDIIFHIIDDDVIESTENLAISLTNPNPPDAVARLGSTTITIINNDFRKFPINCGGIFKIS